MNGPAANTPTPMKEDECAYPSWLAMKPPDESPDTEAWLVFTLYLGSGTAAWAAKQEKAAASATERNERNVIENVSWKWVDRVSPRPPCARGLLDAPVCPGVHFQQRLE